MPENTDLSWRTDRNGNAIITKRAEYVTNIVQMLFSYIPGKDPYEPEKGLNINAHMKQMYVENSRDTAYENEIISQFTTYTDLIPINIVATYMNNTFFIYMEVKYADQIYKIDVSTDQTTLSAVLRTQ